jgi:antirestriction protein ArdC
VKRDIHEAITERFIEQLRKGTVPWRKPWFAVQNIVSRKPYRGINALLLGSSEYQSPFWISFKQALDLGGHVKNGEKSTPVIYYKVLEKRDEAGNIVVREDGRLARIPFVRWANVFNLDQTEGIQAPAITASQNVTEPHKKAIAIVENARLCPIHHAGFAALYSPSDDVIRIPAPSTFHSQEDYYHTLYHEMTHASGHASRLNREGIAERAKFGSQRYSKEELVAGRASMGLTSGFSALPIATRTATVLQPSRSGSTARSQSTRSPGHTANPCRYENPERYPAHLGAPAPSSRSFASFAAANPCRARLRGCKPAQPRRPAWLRPPIPSVLASPRHPAPGGRNRRLHRETTGFFSGTVAKLWPERAGLRPLLGTEGASSPWPFPHRRRRNTAQLPRITGFCPPIHSVLALPQGPAPGEKKGRRRPLRPLKRSPRKPVSGLLERPSPTEQPFLPSRSFSRINDRQECTFPRKSAEAGRWRSLSHHSCACQARFGESHLF